MIKLLIFYMSIGLFQPFLLNYVGFKLSGLKTSFRKLLLCAIVFGVVMFLVQIFSIPVGLKFPLLFVMNLFIINGFFKIGLLYSIIPNFLGYLVVTFADLTAMLVIRRLGLTLTAPKFGVNIVFYGISTGFLVLIVIIIFYRNITLFPLGKALMEKSDAK